MYFLRYMALVACVARAGPTIAARLTADIIELAQRCGRYGYRKVAGLLRQAGWIINDKRVERIWRREGLKVPRSTTQTRQAVSPVRVRYAQARSHGASQVAASGETPQPPYPK